MYRSLTAQTLHYFARPHASVCRKTIGGAAAWRGEDMAARSDWKMELRPSDIVELETALARAKATGKPIAALRRSDFPLPRLSGRISGWRRELGHGRGFLLIRGLPVERWAREDTERAYWCLGHHLGIPGAQNPEGDLLGHVRDTGADPKARDVRQYKTAEHIPFHCDAADVVGLLCLATPRSGGESRIVSSVSVYDELLRRRPDLVERLYDPFLLDTKGEGGVDYFPIPPCRYASGQLRTFWHAEYFRTVMAYDDVPRFDTRSRELLETYDEIASDASLVLDMRFEPGDIQLISNHTVLHSRNEFDDHPELERRRHLLRLWLSLDLPRTLGDRALAMRDLGALLRDLAGHRARRLLRGPAPRS